MPGMRERKLHMMGETKSSRGDYDETKSYMGGGKIKGYKFGGKVRVGVNQGYEGIADAIASGPQATKKKKLRKR